MSIEESKARALLVCDASYMQRSTAMDMVSTYNRRSSYILAFYFRSARPSVICEQALPDFFDWRSVGESGASFVTADVSILMYSSRLE